MSPDLAVGLLVELGFRPGVDSTADPRFAVGRAGLKLALNVLRDQAQRPANVSPPPALGPEKRPRRSDDVPPRGDRPGFVPPVHQPGEPAATPKRRRR